MVHCSIYHVFLYIPCLLLYIHGSLLYIPCFPRKKRICKIMYNSRSNSRSHAHSKAALTTAPRALIPHSVCARYQYVRFCIAGSTSPGGWCRTSGAGPAAPPAPAMTSPARASTWIVRMPAFAALHAGEAEMCRRTAARWRNRPRLESMPDEEQCVHTKRVTRPAASARPGAPADSETGTCGMTANARAGSKSVQTVDIIA